MPPQSTLLVEQEDDEEEEVEKYCEWSPVREDNLKNQTMDSAGNVYANVGGLVNWSTIDTALIGVALGPSKSSKTKTPSRYLPDFWGELDPRFKMTKSTVRRLGPAWFCKVLSAEHDGCGVINGWAQKKCKKCGEYRHTGSSVIMDFTLMTSTGEEDYVTKPWPASWTEKLAKLEGTPSALRRKRKRGEEDDVDAEVEDEEMKGGRRTRSTMKRMATERGRQGRRMRRTTMCQRRTCDLH